MSTCNFCLENLNEYEELPYISDGVIQKLQFCLPNLGLNSDWANCTMCKFCVQIVENIYNFKCNIFKNVERVRSKAVLLRRKDCAFCLEPIINDEDSIVLVKENGALFYKMAKSCFRHSTEVFEVLFKNKAMCYSCWKNLHNMHNFRTMILNNNNKSSCSNDELIKEQKEDDSNVVEIVEPVTVIEIKTERSEKSNKTEIVKCEYCPLKMKKSDLASHLELHDLSQYSLLKRRTTPKSLNEHKLFAEQLGENRVKKRIKKKRIQNKSETTGGKVRRQRLSKEKKIEKIDEEINEVVIQTTSSKETTGAAFKCGLCDFATDQWQPLLSHHRVKHNPLNKADGENDEEEIDVGTDELCNSANLSSLLNDHNYFSVPESSTLDLNPDLNCDETTINSSDDDSLLSNTSFEKEVGTSKKSAEHILKERERRTLMRGRFLFLRNLVTGVDTSAKGPGLHTTLMQATQTCLNLRTSFVNLQDEIVQLKKKQKRLIIKKDKLLSCQ